MENVRIAILNPYDKVCGYMDNQAPESLHYYSDELHQYLKGSANTYSFRCNARHADSLYLTEGNKLAFRYREKDYYLNIMRVTRDEDEVEVEAYSLNFELLNEQKEAYKAAGAMTFKQYLDVFDYEKVVTLGINEVSDKSITHEWTGTETMLARIFSLANVFGAEVEFVPELNQDHSLKRIVLNVYKEHTDTVQGIGTDRTDMVLRYGKNVSGITKTSDITEMYTAIRPIGRNGLTVSSINKTEYDADGKVEYTCPAGKRNIYAVQARDRFPSNLMANENERYIAQIWEYDTDNVNVLYGQALAQLKKSCVPQVSYEVEGYFDTDIGDTVTISDQEYTPELYLQARVTEQQRSFTDPTHNKTTFSNFKELQSQIDPALIQKMNALIEANKVYTCSILTDNGIVFRNSEGSTTLTASVMDVGKDMTDSLKIQWYTDGEKLSTAKSIIVKATDFTGKSVYRFEAKDKNDTIRGYAEVTVANVNDGAPGDPGDPGEDAYTLYLTTTSHVYNADCEGYLSKNISVSTVVVGYKGSKQLTPVIGKIPEVAGLGYSISGTTITITAVKGSDLADNGTVEIPVTLDGIACTLTFSYAKVKDGYHGENARLCTVTGNQIMKYESGSTTPVPEKLVLTAAYQNANHQKWQYLDKYNVWVDFSPSEASTQITITEDSAAWNGNTALIRALDKTETAIDTITLAKLRDGNKGVGVKDVVEQYYSSSSATELLDGKWEDIPQSWENGRYIWTRSIINYTDGSKSTTAPICTTGDPGSNGIGVKSVDVWYYLSSSAASLTGGKWQTTAPAWADGKYMWSKTIITYTDDSTDESAAVCITGSRGPTGTPATAYSMLVSAYAISKNTAGVYTPSDIALAGKSQTGAAALQDYAGRFKIEETTDMSTWSVKYTSGANESAKIYTPSSGIKALRCSMYLAGGTSILLDQQIIPIVSDGKNGDPGKDGKGIKGTETTYQSSTSGTTVPMGTWAASPPVVAANQYLWTRTIILYTDGSKSDPAYSIGKMGGNGDPGKDGKGIKSTETAYQSSTSGTTVPTGTWAATPPTVAANQYLWTRTIIVYTDNTKSNPAYSIGKMGATGAAGKDAYTVVLSNESHTFSGGISAAVAGSTTCKVIAYKGASQVAATIGTITGMPAGMSVSITDNGKTTAYFTVSVTTAMTTKNGTLTVPVTVDGHTFTKTFSFSLSLNGANGAAGTGYTLLLSNESYTFAAGVSAAIAGSTSTGVVAYKNTTQVASTVTKIGSTAVSGNMTGVATGFAGLTADISGNGTTSCKITFKATTALTTKNGSVAITITVDGKSFTKDFSFSLALKGEPGKGDKGDPTGVIESATEPSTKYTGMLWKHTGTVAGLTKDTVYRWTGTKWEIFRFSAVNIDAETFNGYTFNGSEFESEFDRKTGKQEDGLYHRYNGNMRLSMSGLEFDYSESLSPDDLVWNFKYFHEDNISAEGISLLTRSEMGTIIESLRISAEGIFSNFLGIKNNLIYIVDKLNQKLPVVLFSGAKSWSEDIAWNPNLNFSNFMKISMCMTFQGQRHVCDFYPVSNANEKNAYHSFSWNDFSNDGHKRMIAGKLSFAGRYMANKYLAISYDLNSWVDLNASYITIEKIVGYPPL